MSGGASWVPDVSEVAGGPDTPPRDTMSTQRSIRHTDRHVVLSDGRRLTYADWATQRACPSCTSTLTHTDAATRRGLDQQRVFAEEGVDLSRVVIGHCGDTTNLDYLQELVNNGS